ncbi:MAG: iron-sulfur cluster assembly scaffold protein [Cyanobium sp. MAG06]|nr:iron-sulfur cluster assembly scaffold protein [Cyanobium sp. MAG06]
MTNNTFIQTIYEERILNHNNNPHNKYIMTGDNIISGEADNISCGDSGKIFIKLDKYNNIISVSFTGEGCAISQAGLSMMTDYIMGKNINDIEKITPANVYEMLGITISPARALCVNICYNSIREIVKNYNKIYANNI